MSSRSPYQHKCYEKEAGSYETVSRRWKRITPFMASLFLYRRDSGGFCEAHGICWYVKPHCHDAARRPSYWTFRNLINLVIAAASSDRFSEYAAAASCRGGWDGSMTSYRMTSFAANWCHIHRLWCKHMSFAIFIGVRARGLGELQPPDTGKTIIFRAKSKFFGQKPAAKNEKVFFYIY